MEEVQVVIPGGNPQKVGFDKNGAVSIFLVKTVPLLSEFLIVIRAGYRYNFSFMWRCSGAQFPPFELCFGKKWPIVSPQ